MSVYHPLHFISTGCHSSSLTSLLDALLAAPRLGAPPLAPTLAARRRHLHPQALPLDQGIRSLRWSGFALDSQEISRDCLDEGSPTLGPR